MAASCFTQTKTKWDGAGGEGKRDQRKRRRKVCMMRDPRRQNYDCSRLIFWAWPFVSPKGGGRGGGWRFRRDLLPVQAGGGGGEGGGLTFSACLFVSPSGGGGGGRGADVLGVTFCQSKQGGKRKGGGGWRFGRDLLSVQAGGGEAREGKDSGSDAGIMRNAIGDHGDNLEWSWWLALTHWCNLNNWGGKNGTLTQETGGTVWVLVWRVSLDTKVVTSHCYDHYHHRHVTLASSFVIFTITTTTTIIIINNSWTTTTHHSWKASPACPPTKAP